MNLLNKSSWKDPVSVLVIFLVSTTHDIHLPLHFIFLLQKTIIFLSKTLGLSFHAVSVLLSSGCFLLGLGQGFLHFLQSSGVSSDISGLHEGLGSSAGGLGLFHCGVFLGLESSVSRDQTDESLDDEAKEESKASDVEVPLCPEAPHVRLHLNVQMTGSPGVLKLLLLVVILLHLSDGVQEEQNQDGNQNIKVINQLALQSLQEPRLEDCVQGSRRNKRDQEQEDHANLRVEKTGN